MEYYSISGLVVGLILWMLAALFTCIVYGKIVEARNQQVPRDVNTPSKSSDTDHRKD